MKTKNYLRSLVPFTQEELDDILSHFTKEIVKKDEILVREGQICKFLYFVEKGIGRSYYLREDGKEVTQWFFGEDSFMASADSFFKQSPSLYYMELLEDSILYSISKDNLDMLLDKYHKMERFVRLVTIDILTEVNNKLNAIQFQTAMERYHFMISEYPDISNRVPLGHIASYLGMTQETLSRIRKNSISH